VLILFFCPGFPFSSFRRSPPTPDRGVLTAQVISTNWTKILFYNSWKETLENCRCIVPIFNFGNFSRRLQHYDYFEYRRRTCGIKITHSPITLGNLSSINTHTGWLVVCTSHFWKRVFFGDYFYIFCSNYCSVFVPGRSHVRYKRGWEVEV
jgi:hypothetical protein